MRLQDWVRPNRRNHVISLDNAQITSFYGDQIQAAGTAAHHTFQRANHVALKEKLDASLNSPSVAYTEPYSADLNLVEASCHVSCAQQRLVAIYVEILAELKEIVAED